jgi:PAS domain S-box-containing protein
MKTFLQRFNRIILYILVPVMVTGFVFTLVIGRFITTPLTAYFEKKNALELQLAAELGLEACEDNLRKLLSLRLETDPNMVETMRRDALQQIQSRSERFLHIDLMVVEKGELVSENPLTVGLRKKHLEALPDTIQEVSTWKISGKTVFYYSTYFPFWRWHIVSVLPEDEAFTSVNLAKRFVYIALFCILGVLAVTLIIIFFFLVKRPLSRITEATQKISGGTFAQVDTLRNDEIGQVITSFNTMVQNLEANQRQIQSTMKKLGESEERFRKIIENAYTGYFFCNKEGKYEDVNKAWLRLHGYESPSEIIGHHFMTTLCEDDEEQGRRILAKLRSGESIEVSELTRVRKDGSTGYHTFSATPVVRGGAIVGFEGFLMDITERKKMEEMIKKSLQEKEVLLKEIHHRVKNNLNIVASLLNLQLETISSPEDARKSLRISQNRVHSMALVHEKLYESDTLSEIDMDSYIHTLVHELYELYGLGRAITMEVEVEDTSLSIDRAVPCGLLLNELITNSLIHAFPEHIYGHDKEPIISISLHKTPDQGNTLTLKVEDNGIGMSTSSNTSTGIQSHDSLGLKLVRILSDQLEADLRIDSDSGTRFHITFTTR